MSLLNRSPVSLLPCLERLGVALSTSGLHACVPALTQAPPCAATHASHSSASALHALLGPPSQARYFASSSYSSYSGRPVPEPWPVLGPIKTSPQHGGKVKLHNAVVRFPPDLQPTLQGSALILSGRAGTVRLDLPALDPVGLAAFKLLGTGPEAGAQGAGAQQQSGQQQQGQPSVGPFMLVTSPDKDQFQSIVSELNSSIQGCMQGFLVGLTVKGVGYRLEPVDEKVSSGKWYFEQTTYDKSNIAYPFTKPVTAIRLKVGFSRTAIYPLPSDIRAFSIRPNLLYLYGLQLPRVKQVAEDIRAIRKPNVYTGNGIQLVGEVIKLKQRSSRKR